MADGFGSIRHLVGRLAGSLWPGGPDPAGEGWARSWLRPGEADLWARMSGPDRRHALGVGREVAAGLPHPVGAPPRAVVAAALLHDVGKISAGLGTGARVAVTAVAVVRGRDRLAGWAGPGRGLRARCGRYLVHDRLGAELLAVAGSDPFTITWAAEHHLPAARQTTPAGLAALLTAADGD